MSCYLELAGDCTGCRACGSGRDLDERKVQLVRSAEECAPGCTRCAPLRRMIGDGPMSLMAYHSFRTSIERALLMCPTGALVLSGIEPRK